MRGLRGADVGYGNQLERSIRWRWNRAVRVIDIYMYQYELNGLMLAVAAAADRWIETRHDKAVGERVEATRRR